MITITESKPLKVSGRTSFFIFCSNYAISSKITDIVKNELDIPTAWHKKTLTREIPCIYLATILDRLTYLDDITLKLLPEISNEQPAPALLVDYKLKPFAHQIEAIKFGLTHDKWLLLDSPGLGKTSSIIHLAEELRYQRGLKHCLIICGIASLRANWEKEIEKHSNLDYITIGKNVNSRGNVTWAKIVDRADELKNIINEFFVIINVEMLVYDSVVAAINNSKNEFDMIVVDEVHKVKGSKASRSNNLLKLNKANYRIGLSGTLIMNNALDSYMPLKFIDGDKSTLTNFKKLYCEFGGISGSQIIGFKNLDVLKDEIEHVGLRRTKNLMDLPPKNIINEYVEMSDEHRKFYNNVRKGIKEECDKIDLKPNNILSLTTRLKQATTCPSVLTSSPVESSKIERCLDLVEEIVSQGDKVVIMSTYKEPVYRLETLLKQYSPLIATGDMNDNVVSDNIDKFQNDNTHKVFIATSAKCGTGITLNRARYMICIDQAWTAAAQEQTTDRIHRINNTEPVFIYNLICENTIDEKISKILDRKKALGDFIIDDKVDNETLSILKSYILDL